MTVDDALEIRFKEGDTIVPPGEWTFTATPAPGLTIDSNGRIRYFFKGVEMDSIDWLDSIVAERCAPLVEALTDYVNRCRSCDGTGVYESSYPAGPVRRYVKSDCTYCKPARAALRAHREKTKVDTTHRT